MWPHSEQFRRALLGSHDMQTQVDVFDADGLRATNVPIVTGTISANLLSDVCRSGSVTVAGRLVDGGLFDPARDLVRISTGIDGFPLVPIFTGRVQEVTEDYAGQAVVQVDDFGRDIVEAKFEQPWQASQGDAVSTEMRRIIKDVNDDFGLDSSLALPGVVASGLVWEESRGEALDSLAAAINCIWQTERTGSFVLYPNPYNLTEPPSLTITLSDGPSGTLTSLTRNTTRDKVYNSVTVLVERSDNTPPLRVTVRDTSPSSPFLWGGKFGKVNQVLRLQTPGGAGDAALVAQRVLNQSLALARSWRLTTPHFPLLDPGDVIAVTARGDTTVQVVESITYPLEAIAATSIATRELRQQVEVPAT